MVVIEEKSPIVLGFVNEDLSRQNFDGTRFVLPVPSLKHLASFQAALTLWLQKWKEKTPDSFAGISNELKEEILQMVLLISIPKPLKEKLSWDVVQISKKIENFNKFLSYRSINDDISSYDIRHIIWTSMGHIDYVKTVKTMPNDVAIDKEGLLFIYNIDNKQVEMSYFSNKFCMNKYVLYNPHHSIMMEYFNCKDDDIRFYKVVDWLNDILFRNVSPQDLCFLLTCLSKEMLKRLLVEFNGSILLRSFFEDRAYYYEECGLQIANLIRVILPDFDFCDLAKYLIIKRTITRPHSLADKYYLNFFDEFAVFLSQNPTMSFELKYNYLKLRCRMDFRFLKSLSSSEKQEILSHQSYSICFHLIRLYDGRLEDMKKFIKICCPRNEDVTNFKSNFVQSLGIKYIALYYFRRNNLEGLLSFLKWLSEDDAEKTNELKLYIAFRYLHECIVFHCISFHDENTNFSMDKADSFLNWITSGDSNEILFVKDWYLGTFPEHMYSYNTERCQPYKKRVVAWLCDYDRTRMKLFWNEPVYHCNNSSQPFKCKRCNRRNENQHRRCIICKKYGKSKVNQRHVV